MHDGTRGGMGGFLALGFAASRVSTSESKKRPPSIQRSRAKSAAYSREADLTGAATLACCTKPVSAQPST